MLFVLLTYTGQGAGARGGILQCMRWLRRRGEGGNWIVTMPWAARRGEGGNWIVTNTQGGAPVRERHPIVQHFEVCIGWAPGRRGGINNP